MDSGWWSRSRDASAGRAEIPGSEKEGDEGRDGVLTPGGCVDDRSWLGLSSSGRVAAKADASRGTTMSTSHQYFLGYSLLLMRGPLRVFP